jgi:DNA repair and recombination protein RAD54B
MADSSLTAELVGTLQAGSINKHPSVKHDLNPSTAASKKQPVTLSQTDEISEAGEDEIPLSVLKPLPRRNNLPPLPDLRFEQSYLRSIEKAETPLAIAWITFKDQVCYSEFDITSAYVFTGPFRFVARHNSRTRIMWMAVH